MVGVGCGGACKHYSRFLALAGGTVLATLFAGAAGILATLLLHAVEGFINRLEGTDQPWLIPVVMAAAGLLAGGIWWGIRRKPLSNLKAAVKDPEADFPLVRNVVDAAVQVFIVGVGASVGREVAPRQFATALMHWASRPVSALTVADRRVLMAASAGAALGAVYNTPYAGALYTLSVMLGSLRIMPLIIALISSWGGVLLASVVHTGSSYYSFPAYELSAKMWLLLPLLAVVGAVLGGVFHTLCSLVKDAHVERKFLPVTVAAVMGITGLVTLWEPDIAGNGVLIMQNGFNGDISMATFGVLIVLKPLFTLLTLRAGAVGGVLTPSLALGGAAGGYLAHLLGAGEWLTIIMACAAAAVLSVSEGSAWFGTIFTAELIGADIGLTLLIVVVGFTAYFLRQAGALWLRNRGSPCA